MKHRVQEVKPPALRPLPRDKEIPAQGQLISNGILTAGDGYSQGASGVMGLHALDGNPRRQYL
ncbi:MAG: hypothetical protein KFH87_05190 [Bacteroidetes bacterium]|nr:hypothetical protein [Bacteroidota bacterium]